MFLGITVTSITLVAMALILMFHGVIMRLISDFEEAAFIAIVVVMAALAVVVVAAV